MNWQIHAFDTLPSTQIWLRQRAQELPAGTVVVARTQTEGHGRMGRAWYSSPGGLYVSLLLKPASLMPGLPFLLLWASLSALEKNGNSILDLKHPNDIYWQGKKLAGVLADAQIMGLQPAYYVCGIGINLNQADFPQDIPATSLYQMTGKYCDPQDFLQDLLTYMEQGYTLLADKPEYFYQRFVADLGERPIIDPTRDQAINAKEWLYEYQ